MPVSLIPSPRPGRPSPSRRAGPFLAALVLITACAEEDPLISKAQWTFINYWAEWCKPCIKEIPELNALDRREAYRVLGVNFDGATDQDLQEQVSRLNVAFPTLAEDPSARFGLERPAVLPTTFVIAPGGTLHTVLIGPQTAESLIAATRTDDAADAVRARQGPGGRTSGYED